MRVSVVLRNYTLYIILIRLLMRTCHDTALSHCVHPEAALTHTDPFVVGGAERATCKDIRSEIIAAALVRRGLRQPTHGLHGRRP